MSASCVVRDEATGATYLDMVTTSVGRVTLSGPESDDSRRGAQNRGCNGPCLKSGKIPALGGRKIPILLLSRQNQNRLPMCGQAC